MLLSKNVFSLNNSSRKVVFCLWAIFLTRGLILACIVPAGEMWDEYSHLAHVDFWARYHTQAIYGQSLVDFRLLKDLNQLPLPVAADLGFNYSDFWGGSPSPRLPASRGLYEAQQPFLYYWLVSPVYNYCRHHYSVSTTISVLRLVNLLAGSIAIVVLAAWIPQHTNDKYCYVIMCWTCLHPLILLNVVRVANDALAFLLGTIVVVASLNLTPARFKLGVITIAIVLPISVLAKFTNASLVPFVVVSLFVGANAGIGRRSTFIAVGIVFMATFAILFPYVAFNIKHYGLITPMQEAVANREAGRPLFRQLTAMPFAKWPVLVISWWAINGLWVGGWTFIYPPRFFEALYAVSLTLGLSGLILNWRSIHVSSGVRLLIVILILAIHAAMMLHAVESFSAWQGRVFTNPWYAAVGLPWLLILIGSGASVFRPEFIGKVVLYGTPILFIVVEWFGSLLQMPSTYYVATPFGARALSRMASIHPIWLGPQVMLGAWVLEILLLVHLGRQISGEVHRKPGALLG